MEDPIIIGTLVEIIIDPTLEKTCLWDETTLGVVVDIKEHIYFVEVQNPQLFYNSARVIRLQHEIRKVE